MFVEFCFLNTILVDDYLTSVGLNLLELFMVRLITTVLCMKSTPDKSRPLGSDVSALLRKFSTQTRQCLDSAAQNRQSRPTRPNTNVTIAAPVLLTTLQPYMLAAQPVTRSAFINGPRGSGYLTHGP